MFPDSAEILSLIFEHACSDDLGQTARRLGLVSRSFRNIAEPLELRAIAISGLVQLEHVVKKLERLQVVPVPDKPKRAEVIVKHLFISELTGQHAKAIDTDFYDVQHQTSSWFWWTEDGVVARSFYHAFAAEFWRLATGLIRRTHTTLKTLFLLASDNWFTLRGSYRLEPLCPKVLGALSGVEFPNLESLTVNHDVSDELCCFGEGGQAFIYPAFPSLRRIRIISSIFLNRNELLPRRVHPLLSDILSQARELTHVILWSNETPPACAALSAIFGEDREAFLRDQTLPGNLLSVVLRMSIATCLGFIGFQRWKQTFTNEVQERRVYGLKAEFPKSIRSEGEAVTGEYGLLMADWRELALAPNR